MNNLGDLRKWKTELARYAREVDRKLQKYEREEKKLTVEMRKYMKNSFEPFPAAINKGYVTLRSMMS